MITEERSAHASSISARQRDDALEDMQFKLDTLSVTAVLLEKVLESFAVALIIGRAKGA